MTTLTVLFTDLVGSTALMGQLGADRFDQLLTEHDLLVDNEIATHGGRKVKHTGDGVMAVFTGATEALNTTVGIQQSVDRRNRRAATAIAVRVGLSAGDLTEKDDDYFGTPAVEAARLCAVANASQILAAEVVTVLAGSRGDHDFNPLGRLELKGLPPLAAVEVSWNKRADEHLPLPAAFIEPRGRLIGRDSELERLLDAWKTAQTGVRQMVMVSGEPGIGKTRLVTELARHAQNEGASVVLGRCEDGFGAPYKPFAEIITHLLLVPDSTELIDWAEQHGPDVGRITRAVRDRFPAVGEPRNADPDTMRLRVCDGINALLGSAAATDPVLVVLDDLHWADDASLLLLRHLARSTAPTDS